jgi:hypothetical protein
MALPDRHPEYVYQIGNWLQCHDCFEGERAIKSKRLDYLPATDGMVQDGMTTPSSPGWRDYNSYLMRAHFHDIFKDAVKAMIGILCAKPAEITLPDRLGDMVDQATRQGESLQFLLRKIFVHQLVYGRCGLLTDCPTGMDVNKALPYLTFYNPQRIINWDSGHLNEGREKMQLVVLDETGLRREGFTWKTERKYRILTRGTPESLESGWETPGPDADYALCVKVNDTSLPTTPDFIVPQIGGRTLKDIPFVFIGANDLVPEPEVPPLLGLSSMALAIYRADADYRQTLHLQGQNTLVLIGQEDEGDDAASDQPLRIGNKGIIRMRLQGDAKYIGVSAAGLGEMRQSLENDKNAAALEGWKFLDVGNSQGESGEALRIRVEARTTTLQTVAKVGAAGLERALRYCALLVGEDPMSVTVKPRTDFADQSVQGAALLAYMQAKQLGLPLSLESLHGILKANDLTGMTFDEEKEAIEEEAESLLGSMVSPMDPTMGTEPPIGGQSPTDDPNDPANKVQTPGQPKGGPGSSAPRNKNTPVKPHARAKGHLRGSPTPLKKKVGSKGASAGKGTGKGGGK